MQGTEIAGDSFVRSRMTKESRSMGNVKEISDSDFAAEVLESSQPVLVDFWAPWCGPCRMIAPIVEQLATENAAACKVCKVNIDDSTADRRQLRHQQHPHLDALQGGRSGRTLRRRAIEKPPARGHQPSQRLTGDGLSQQEPGWPGEAAENPAPITGSLLHFPPLAHLHGRLFRSSLGLNLAAPIAD